MSELQDIRRRIKSITHTAQITRAMQNIARSRIAYSLKKFRESESYASGVAGLIRTTYRDTITPIPNRSNNSKTHLVVLMTPHRGLCGALNHNIFRLIDTLSSEDTHYVTIGRKGEQYLAQNKLRSVASFHLELNPTDEDCRKPAQFCLQYLAEHQVNRLSILFPSYVSAMVQNAQIRAIFPFCEATLYSSVVDASADKPKIYEPCVHSLIKKFIPAHVNAQIYHALLSARASECFARMVAMKLATDNAEDLITSLNHKYHKIRQETITSGILDATSAGLN